MGGVVIGVTGSVGKTGTKEALFAALERPEPGQAHRSVKSYNNHTGVPLSLARMPRDTRFGVFEMGMNHAGELAALTRIVRPHIAIVTTIAPAHTEFFDGEEAIADAKGEIFQGLEPGGTAIVPFDSPHRDRLIAAATGHAARIVTFGLGDGADVRAVEVMHGHPGGTFVTAKIGAEKTLSFLPCRSRAIIGLPMQWPCWPRWTRRAAIWSRRGWRWARWAALPGAARGLPRRSAGGEALVIDESYNANPASMARDAGSSGREPGDAARSRCWARCASWASTREDYHADLAEPLVAAGVEAFALLVGEEMAPLAAALEGQIDFVHVPDAASARVSLDAMLRAGDAVLIKGSNGVGLSRVVAALAGRG